MDALRLGLIESLCHLRLIYPVLQYRRERTVHFSYLTVQHLWINFWRMVGLYISMGPHWANALECWRSPSWKYPVLQMTSGRWPTPTCHCRLNPNIHPHPSHPDGCHARPRESRNRYKCSVYVTHEEHHPNALDLEWDMATERERDFTVGAYAIFKPYGRTYLPTYIVAEWFRWQGRAIYCIRKKKITTKILIFFILRTYELTHTM